MDRMKGMLLRLRMLVARGSVEREMDDELRFHIEMETEKNVRAGLSRATARRAAVAAFGGVDRHTEAMRDGRGWTWLEDIVRDTRCAARALLHNPGFAAAAVLTLALAIGTNSAVFTLVNGMILRPFAGPEPERLVALWGVDARDGGAVELGYEDYADWRDKSGLFSSVAARVDAPLSLGTDGAAEVVWTELVTGNYFSTIGLRPVLGRFFVAGEETRLGASPYVVLSYDLWQRRFNADPRIVGQQLRLNGSPVEVVGVAPRNFHGVRRFGFWPEVWVPLGAPGTADQMRGHGAGNLVVFGRLRPGITAERAQVQATAFARGLSETYPATNRGLGALLTSARAPFDSPRFVPPRTLALAAMLGIVGVSLVLLIACANVANLLLARALARRREIAVRLSIGGDRGRLIRQLLTESALLAMLGGVGGLVLSVLSSRWQKTMLPQLTFRVGVDTSMDHRVVLFTAFIAFVAVFVFGLAPALHATRVDLVTALRNDAAPRLRGKRRPELRDLLVVGQLAMSVLLLIAGTLFLRSLDASRSADLGVATTRRVLISANPNVAGYNAPRAAAYYRAAAERVAALPDVVSAAWAFPVPFDSYGHSAEVYIEGAGDRSEKQTVQISLSVVDPGYFETIGTRLLDGRAFTLADSATAPRVLIVNRTMAERFWPGRRVLGQLVRMGSAEGAEVRVVGIVENAKYMSPTEPARPYAYFPTGQRSTQALTLVVHTRTGGETAIGPVRAVLRTVAPDVPTYGAITMERSVRNALNAQEGAASVATTLAVLALVLAAIGLYGVVAYSVERRTREVGIRIALGARPASVVGLLLGRAARLTLTGIAIGLAAAFGVGRAISSLLYGVSGTDPLTFIGIPVIMTAVALLAAYIPARRAIRIHPVTALRRE